MDTMNRSDLEVMIEALTGADLSTHIRKLPPAQAEAFANRLLEDSRVWAHQANAIALALAHAGRELSQHQTAQIAWTLAELADRCRLAVDVQVQVSNRLAP